MTRFHELTDDRNGRLEILGTSLHAGCRVYVDGKWSVIAFNLIHAVPADIWILYLDKLSEILKNRNIDFAATGDDFEKEVGKFAKAMQAVEFNWVNIPVETRNELGRTHSNQVLMTYIAPMTNALGATMNMISVGDARHIFQLIQEAGNTGLQPVTGRERQ